MLTLIHKYLRNAVLPEWHGWHAFRRGLATNLHRLGVDDLTIQGDLAALETLQSPRPVTSRLLRINRKQLCRNSMLP
jgi:hypothetical protein